MKTYEFHATSNPAIKRVVDRDGEWQNYFHVPTRRYLRGVTTVLHRGYAKSDRFHQWLKNHTKDEIDAALRFGRDKGDAGHQLANLILLGEKVTTDTLIVADDNRTKRVPTWREWEAILSFERFIVAHGIRIVAHEHTVCNVREGYAGTFDGIVRLMKACGVKVCACSSFVGLLLLLDWKFGGGIYPEMGAQVAAYSNADLSEILHGHQLAGTGIVRFGTRHKTTGGYEPEFYDARETAGHWTEFLAAMKIDDATFRPFDPRAIVAIPTSLSLTVEREHLEPPRRKQQRRKKPAPRRRQRTGRAA